MDKPNRPLTPGIELREARGEDAALLAALAIELGYPVTEAALFRRLERALGSRDEDVFVAQTPEGGIAGWVHVFIAHRLESAAFAELGGLVVESSWRRLGVGRRLVERATAWAEARSLGRLRARSDLRREASHAFYPALGFRRVKEQAVYDHPAPSDASESGE